MNLYNCFGETGYDLNNDDLEIKSALNVYWLEEMTLPCRVIDLPTLAIEAGSGNGEIV